MIRSGLNLLVVGVAALTAGGCEIQAQSMGVDGAFDRTLRVEGPIDLDVLSRSGHIRVAVGPDDTVHIAGHIRAYGSFRVFNAYTAAEQARELERNPPIEQRSNRINVGYIEDWALANNVRIDYDVTAPASTRLKTSTRSGDQTIDAIYGPVTATSRSGRVHIGGVRGDIDLETRSGDVDLVDQHSNVRVVSRSGRVTLEGQPARTWEVETRSGDVDVQLPRDGGADLNVDTRSGSIDSSRPIEMRSSQSKHRMQGVVGQGGGRLQVTTRSGSVRIR